MAEGPIDRPFKAGTLRPTTFLLGYTKPKMLIRALVFDFDGTILDTETPEFQAWQEVYAEFGASLPLPIWAESIGRGHDTVTFDPYSYLEAQTGQRIDYQTVRMRKRERFTTLILQEKPRAGVVAYLEQARDLGLGLAVASSSDRAWVEGHLKRLNLLSYFALTRCSDDVTRTKPSPDLYLSACEGLGVAPGEAVAFEDSLNGLRAAKAAGLYSVATPNAITKFLPLEPEADLFLPSLADLSLPDLLNRATLPASSDRPTTGFSPSSVASV